MNTVIQDIEESGLTELPNGQLVQVHSNVGPGSGRVIKEAIQKVQPKLGCEVGLAFGASTLYILDAMKRFGGGKLIGMDPAQFDDTWQGGGLHNVKRAGFADDYEFHAESSQLVLPRLAAAGTRIQFGFLDGWHTFDHTLVDFFYLDMMMDVGGVVILDDVGYPSLQRLAHFIVTNRSYSVIDADTRPRINDWKNRAKHSLQTLLSPLVRDNHTPSKSSLAKQHVVNSAQLVALQKTSHDSRSFDHFVPF